MNADRNGFAWACLLLAGCNSPVEVDHPFYLTFTETRDQMALYRCPDGPDGGCARDGLPGPAVAAAGANNDYLVVRTSAGYYYFRRVPQETSGWGNNPEKIVGPLTADEFGRAKAQFKLPDFTVMP